MVTGGFIEPFSLCLYLLENFHSKINKTTVRAMASGPSEADVETKVRPPGTWPQRVGLRDQGGSQGRGLNLAAMLGSVLPPSGLLWSLIQFVAQLFAQESKGEHL